MFHIVTVPVRHFTSQLFLPCQRFLYQGPALERCVLCVCKQVVRVRTVPWAAVYVRVCVCRASRLEGWTTPSREQQTANAESRESRRRKTERKIKTQNRAQSVTIELVSLLFRLTQLSGDLSKYFQIMISSLA